jgi:peptidyl-prolyl cis-trans isomerase SurA
MQEFRRMTQNPKRTRGLFGLMAAAAVTISASVATAQSLFSPAVIVNDKAITYFEIDQRARFYEFVRRFGDLDEIARKDLIDDRLKQQAAAELGIELDPEVLTTGMQEFAGRANLKAEQLIVELGKEGISAETFRDFVSSGLIWREVINARFRSRVQITEDEIDAALGTGGEAGLRVLLSEIVIPLTPQTEEQVQDLATQISKLKSQSAFEDAATRFSAAGSRTNGGRMSWIPLSRLPGPIQTVVIGLKPGEITAPIELDRAIALFQMRGIAEMPAATPRYAAIEYGVLRLAGGRSPETLAKAQKIRETVDTCDDLYGVNKGGPDEALDILAQVPSEIPRDIALELAKLDRHEVSTALTSSDGSQLLFVMLCGRTAAINEDVKREDVANAILNRRLSSYAEGYLGQLRSEAVIVNK